MRSLAQILSCAMILVHDLNLYQLFSLVRNGDNNKIPKEIQIWKSKSCWEQLCRSEFGSNRVSLIWEQSCHSHLGAIVSVSLQKNCAKLTWEKLCQIHLGIIVPVSLKNNCVSTTQKKPCQFHLRIIVPLSLGKNVENNVARVPLVQLVLLLLV